MGGSRRVLIVCTGNSCRSQMAEALWRHESEGRDNVTSAGTRPAGVNPSAYRVIQELGIDPSGQYSKQLTRLIGNRYDIVVTVCDNARDACPAFPNSGEVHHWPFPDPIHTSGTENEVLAGFRSVRDQIRTRIRTFLKESPPAKAVR